MIWDKRNEKTKDEWLTPPPIIDALGVFDLDPCAPVKPPWRTARKQYSLKDDGFLRPWRGRVWLNPPYGGQCPRWIRRLADHGDGVALVAARVDTKWFQEVYRKADGVLFLLGRLRFFHGDGKPATYSAGFPSALMAFGKRNAAVLRRSGLGGLFIVP